MRPRACLLVVSSLTTLGLLASCAPAAAPTPAPKAAARPPVTQPAAPTAKAAAPAAPAATPKPAGEQPRRGGILRIGQDADPPHLDPHQATSAPSYMLIYPSYGGLTRWDQQNTDKMLSDLAREWSVSEDGKTYTFRLRDDAKWHDGRPVTAQDAKFSLERVKIPPSGVSSRWATLFLKVAEVSAADAQTLKVTLSQAQPAFLTFASQPWLPIAPKHVVDAEGQDILKRKVVGSSGFKLKTYERGVSYETERFKDYFVKDRPYLDGFKTFIVPDAGSRFAALRTAQLDLISTFPGVTAAQVEEMQKPDLKDKLVAQRGVSEAFWYFAMNNTRKPWNDVRVRQAVSLAWDRRSAIQAIEDGFGEEGGPMPPSGQWAIPRAELLAIPGYRPDKAADIAEAKKLLSEAGYPAGFQTTIMTRQGPTYEKGAVYASDQLARMGIKATLNVLENTSHVNARLKKDYDTDVQAIGVGIDDPDAGISINFVTGGGQNHTAFSDPEVDRLFREQSVTLDQAKRKQTVLELQKRLLERAPLVIQFWRGRALAHQKYLKGYYYSPNLYKNWTLTDAWLDK
ncbi:MAG: hypothetical protein HYX92_00620 [Chloroflexi bacterium]|nr:hypothetical protein [Chloroflexota bacterium]